jgi:hypothetical protein
MSSLYQNTGHSFYYLCQVKIEGNPFVVGVGHGADKLGHDIQPSLFNVNVSMSSSLKMTASFRDIAKTELQLQ